MTAGGLARTLVGDCRLHATRWVLRFRIRLRHPTLFSDPTAIWDYGYSDIDAIDLGERVWVGAFAEVIVQRHARHSGIEGRLSLADGVVISTGVNLRAAGGTIRLGAGSVLSQHCVVVAANHRLEPGVARIHTPWDETRCGVEIGANVWIGAGCVVLPGVLIGDNAVIAAGSVVRGEVPAGELWGGVPARYIRTIE
jgi:acetyltransferase-like isoleucine patch superfamily enzyme